MVVELLIHGNRTGTTNGVCSSPLSSLRLPFAPYFVHLNYLFLPFPTNLLTTNDANVDEIICGMIPRPPGHDDVRCGRAQRVGALRY